MFFPIYKPEVRRLQGAHENLIKKIRLMDTKKMRMTPAMFENLSIFNL